MSRYIGKRVSYPCNGCGKQFTLNKKSIDDSLNSGNVYCSEECSKWLICECGNYSPKSKTDNDCKYCNGRNLTKKEFNLLNK